VDALVALIEFERVSKYYAGSATAAVADLNLKVEAGEFLTLLGPSGSGKTTTLMLLAGFEVPSAGTICLRIAATWAWCSRAIRCSRT
jgi:putative spermidine/putrescine transport system ATP-binding protein